MDLQQLKERLKKADEDASSIYDGEKIVVPIAGGADIILNGLGRVISHDIDITQCPSMFIDVFERYDINSRMSAFTFFLPHKYEDRLIPVDISTKVFDYRTLAVEDLLILKLASDRDKDIEDRENPLLINKINWDKLEDIINHELCVGPGQRKGFDYNYKVFKEKYKKK